MAMVIRISFFLIAVSLIIVYSVVPIFLQPRVGWDGSVGALVIPFPGGVVDKFGWRSRKIL
jgi:hypothetical protein